jgi:hypothetical protein
MAKLTLKNRKEYEDLRRINGSCPSEPLPCFSHRNDQNLTHAFDTDETDETAQNIATYSSVIPRVKRLLKRKIYGYINSR